MAINFKDMRSKDEFEELCRQLVCADNPNAVPVEANPGDESIDAFEGVIDEKVDHIWQFKHFPHGIGKSQQDQIRRSLKDAVERHKPSKWTLLTSTDLSPNNLRWLKMQKRKFEEVDIRIIGATAIRRLLLQHQGIRKQYFPLQDEKTDALMRMVAADDRNDLPKARILQDVQEDIAILNDSSPNFRFTFSFDEGETRIGVAPRTSEARDIPLAKVNLEFPKDDAEATAILERVEADMDAGRPVVVPGQYVTIRESVFDQFMGEGRRISELRMIPKLPDINLPSRFHISHGNQSATVPYVDLRLSRRGRKEVEFTNVAQASTPFRVRVTFKDVPPATVEISLTAVTGMRPSDVIEFERFLAIMGRIGAQLTLESLSSNATITSEIEVAGEELPQGRLRFYEDLLLIQEKLDPDLVLPDEISEDDLASVLGIARALRTGRATKQGTASVILIPNNLRQIIELAERGEPLTWVMEDSVESFVLFSRHYEFDVRAEISGPIEILEEGLEDGGIRLGLTGTAYFTYRDGRCTSP